MIEVYVTHLATNLSISMTIDNNIVYVLLDCKNQASVTRMYELLSTFNKINKINYVNLHGERVVLFEQLINNGPEIQPHVLALYKRYIDMQNRHANVPVLLYTNLSKIQNFVRNSMNENHSVNVIEQLIEIDSVRFR